MLEELFGNFDSQLQFGLMVLILVMGAMIFRAHRQITKLASTSDDMAASLGKLATVTEAVATLAKATVDMREMVAEIAESGRVVARLSTTSEDMQRSLERLERATYEITRRTEETEETLRSNLEEYRMAQGSTNAYREYLQRMGLAPASDVEPILEAIGDGAEAVSIDGKILYTNRAFADLTAIHPGATLDEVVARCDVRDFGGQPLTVGDLPESRVLAGEIVHGVLVRVRPIGRDHDVILSVNGQPARDGSGRVVAAVMLSREVSEEIAMAIEVRRRAGDEGRSGPVSWAN